MAPDNTQPLRVQVTEQDQYVVLAPVGEVDIASVDILKDALNRYLDRDQVRLVVDLQGIDYLDSTGLGCVTAARRRAQDAGGDLVLVCTRERILRLFTITGLDQVFTICGTVAQAASQLGGSGS